MARRFLIVFLAAALLAHLEQVVNVAGVHAVALGSDWDGTSLTPVGLEHAGRLPNLTRALVDRGYDGHEIQLMLGDNFLRVFRQVTGDISP
ncbi:MAG: membrane dipeptidase [bacterium]